jgi:hypothetical protein
LLYRLTRVYFGSDIFREYFFRFTFFERHGMRTLFILLTLTPMIAFGCIECKWDIEQAIDDLSEKIARMEIERDPACCEVLYLVGKMDGLAKALRIIDNSGCARECP